MKKTGLLIATTAIGLVLAIPQANAAGYAIKETSATMLKNAFAGAAATKGDISAMHNNPATMTSLKGHRFAASASFIIPSAKFKDGGSSTDTNNNGGDGGKNAVVPALYAMWDLQNNFKIGLGVTAPFGLTTQYNVDWKGRYHAIKSELKTININPSVAYKVNDFVSLGFGISFQYADVELTKKINNVAFGGIGDATSKATGDDWGTGFNLGVLVEPMEGTRIGIAYRSKIAHGLSGDINVSNVAAGAVAVGLVNGVTKITADLTTPDSLSFAVAQEFGKDWTVMASAVMTRWTHFNELDIRSKTGATTIGTVERQAWKNVWFFALGANWKIDPNWNLGLGVAYDQSPINNRYRTPKLPGNDRTWVSAGLDYTMTDWAKVSLTYTHVFIKDGKLDNTNSATAALPAGNRLQGKFKNKVDIIGLQANFKF